MSGVPPGRPNAEPARPKAPIPRARAAGIVATVDQLLVLDRIPDAERQARAALEADPTFGRAHAALARCFVARGALDEADQASQVAMQVAPKDHDVLHTRVRVLRERGETSAAMAVADDTLRMDPSCVLAHQLRAWLLRDRYRHREALAEADEMLRLNPASAEGLNERFLCLSKLGRLAEAESAIRAALRQRPNDSTLMNNLGIVRQLHGDFYDSQERFREAARLNPGSSAAVRNVERTEAFIRQRELSGNPVTRRNRLYGVVIGARSWLGRRTWPERLAILAGLGVGGIVFHAAWVLIGPAIWTWISVALEPRTNRRWATRSERWLREVFSGRVALSLAPLTAMVLTVTRDQPLAGLLGVLLLPAIMLALARTGRERWIAWSVVGACLAAAIGAIATMTEDLALVSVMLWMVVLYVSWLSPTIVERLAKLGV